MHSSNAYKAWYVFSRLQHMPELQKYDTANTGIIHAKSLQYNYCSTYRIDRDIQEFHVLLLHFLSNLVTDVDGFRYAGSVLILLHLSLPLLPLYSYLH